MEQARLERLTSSGDTFSADFFTTMLGHPILRALAQGMVFVSHGKDGAKTFRVAEDGTPYVIDVNPNCDISPDAGVARAALVAGMKYPQLIGRICDIALERYRHAHSKARAA